MARLTAKQEKFCIEYVANGGNASEAYRTAYNTERMKNETIHRCAHELLQNPKVAARIETLITEERNRLRRKYEIDNDRVMQQYVKLAFSDVRKLFDEHGGLVEVHKLDDATAAAVGSIKVKRRLEGDDEQKGIETTEIRILDKRQPLQDIAKMLGLFEEDNRQRNPEKKTVINNTFNVAEHLGELYPDPQPTKPTSDEDEDNDRKH